MSETKMQLEDWLDDLCVRFIINLPREELESVERICFQVEEAQWFYEDFIRPLDPGLPSLSLKAFALRIFQHCPLMSQWSHYHHITAFSEFLAYKTRVPVRGAIMLNQDMDEVVLVKGWKKGANWSFPRGKINKDEKDLDCAIREVYEETGFDIREAGLVKDEKDVKFIEITMREQHMRLYVFRGVPFDAHFEPRTRKEISKIEWYKLSELPTLKKNKQQDQGSAATNANKFYMVAPFLHPLKKWIAQQKKLETKTFSESKQFLPTEEEMSMDETPRVFGGTPIQRLGELPALSDLPEVTSSQDVSSHLKRLLNISGAPAVQAALQHDEQLQASKDSAKSDALLALLRTSTQNQSLPQNPRPVDAVHSQHAYPPPVGFPGFPQQALRATGPNSVPQPHMPFPWHHGHPHHHIQSPVNLPSMAQDVHQQQQLPFRQHSSPIRTEQQPLGYPGASRGPILAQSLPQIQRQPPAPYQQTGDPQFAQPSQPNHTQGLTVPPASKLPPPKLTSHSLALLNVFKDERIKTPQPSMANMVPGMVKEPVARRKPSQHQDNLLGLLKGASPSPGQPVELSAHQDKAPPKQILQRPQGDASHIRKQPAEDTKVSATVSGPLNMPQLDTAILRSNKKAMNGSRPQSRKGQRTQELASPITILTRPQAARRDFSAPVERPTHNHSQARAEKSHVPEPAKPFQPQILRRGEKPGLETFSTDQKKDMNTVDQSNAVLPVIPGRQQAPNQINFDRRPSQTSAQKEALLSLFGKPATAVKQHQVMQLEVPYSSLKASTASTLVSPLSPSQVPSRHGSISGLGTPSESGSLTPTANRVASPVNKAFLLGFLEGVAKGSK